MSNYSIFSLIRNAISYHENWPLAWRSPEPKAEYDVVIVDIRLPDMNGYDLMVRLKDIMDPVPLVLMTGFGYDPGHSIVKARKAGLLPAQRLARHRRTLATLEKFGHGETRFARATRAAVRRLEITGTEE